MANLVSHSGQSSAMTFPDREYFSKADISKSKNSISMDFEQRDLLKFLSILNHQVDQSLIKVNLSKEGIQINSLALVKWINGRLSPFELEKYRQKKSDESII